MNRFLGKLAVQQRVLPNYRAPFFELLASACDGGMSLFTGLPRESEGITTTNQLQITNYRLGKNIHLFSGWLYLCYQRGLIDWLEKWNPDALIVEANPQVDRLIRTGDTARGIPGCQSCHGMGAGGPIETPTISGQYRQYLITQLQNYGTDARRNDVFARMRGIAKKLSKEEIELLARFYAEQ